MVDVKATLTEVKILYTDQSCWARDGYAFSDEKRPCDPTDPKAACWCLGGAIRKVLNIRVNGWLPDEILDAFKPYINNIASFNDHHTFEEVMLLLDTVIFFYDWPSKGESGGETSSGY